MLWLWGGAIFISVQKKLRSSTQNTNRIFMKCRSICRKQKLSVGDCLGEEYVEITERIDENFYIGEAIEHSEEE